MKYLEKLKKGFFAFWIVKYKITYLITVVIIIYGIVALNKLPKESDPEVNLPMVRINTKYEGVTAAIIDDEITEEIEKSIEDVEGISSIDSTSSEGSSSISVEIADGYDIDEVISEIEDAVDSTNLPSGIEDEPSVHQMDFSSTDMFSTILYASDEDFTFEELLDLAELVKQNTSGKNGIKDVEIDTDTIYDIRVILSKEKMDSLGLSMSDISSTISNNHIDSPIGTYDINGTSYSFKLSGKLKDYSEILNIDLLIGDSFIKLSDVAFIDLYYGDEKINKFGQYKDSGYIYISLTYSKLAGANIFDVAPTAKQTVEEELEKEIYGGVSIFYTNDESETVQDDFNSLYSSVVFTLFLVFITLIFFVGFRESLIATFILPIAFLLAFIVVYYKGETLNQMTTFGFVLAFGIAIDTIIVIIEGASEKMKQGFASRTASLSSLKEYKSPLIIGTLTTIAAFFPILTLPGAMGIFLSFIPMVVFITLICTLLVSLTIAGALFTGLSKNKKVYEVFKEEEEVMGEEEKKLLEFERTGKKQVLHTGKGLREKVLQKMGNFYEGFMTKILKTRFNRFASIFLPIIFFILSIMFLLPNIGFEIFPSGAMDRLSMSISGPEKYEPSDMTEETHFIEETLSNTHEITDYTISISSNSISISMNLLSSIERKNANEMTNDELQEYLTKIFKEKLSSKGFNIGASMGMRGPGSGNPVGIYITTTNADYYNDVIEISEDFKKYLESIDQVSEVSLTSSDSVGEIEFSVDSKKAALLGLTEKDVFNQISTAIRGTTAGSIKGISDDNDIKIYFDKFLEDVKPTDIENINIYSGNDIIKAGSVITYKITKSAPSIQRGDGDIQVGINASLKDTSYTSQIQEELNNYAKEYTFPKGITYKEGGENVENSDLISSVISGVFIAFFLIFTVLVYQFNSFRQPAIIMYSVFMSIIGVMIGLFITGNPMSMPAGVGFISLMGIVVNDAIVMIDKMNNNIKKGMDFKTSIIKGSSSRLNPVLVTTITTVAGIIPVALQSPMWAGLGYTIAFGLVVGSFMTLFAIPSLFYTIRRKPKNFKS